MLIGWQHPIIFKWLSGTARFIGKPINAKVYINAIQNTDTRVYSVDTRWDASETTDYLVHFSVADSTFPIKFLSVFRDRSLIGLPSAAGKRDYDIIGGYLLQSETGSKFSDLRDDMKGLDFDPELNFTEKSIHFKIPATCNHTGFDSVRIEL